MTAKKCTMSWDNYGYNGWQIDHKAVHYNNLQPLWANENLRKGKQDGC